MKKGKSIKKRKEKNYLGLHSILFGEMFHSFLVFLKQNEILFYDSFTHFFILLLHLLFVMLLCLSFFYKSSIDVGKHCWRAFEKWIRKYFLKIGINSYLCFVFFFVYFCLIAEILLLDEWRNKRTHWMFSWSIEHKYGMIIFWKIIDEK